MPHAYHYMNMKQQLSPGTAGSAGSPSAAERFPSPSSVLMKREAYGLLGGLIRPAGLAFAFRHDNSEGSEYSTVTVPVVGVELRR